MNKRLLIPPLIINSMIVILTIIGLIIGCTMDGFDISILKYFTTDSNLLMGIASLIYVIYLILIFNNKVNNIPKPIRIFKLVTTVGVVLTFMTVITILAPASKDAVFLFSNSQSIFHVVTPFLSLVTWLLFEHNKDFKLPECCYGLIPTFVYGTYYLIEVLTHIQNGKVMSGYDWYGFTVLGLNFIPLVIVLILGATFLISWLLWLGNKKIDIKYDLMNRMQYKRFWAIFVDGFIALMFIVALLVRYTFDGNDYTNLKYFTTQSNIIMGIMAIVYMSFQIKQFNKKEINKTASLLKLFATTYVALTFIITVFVLTPGMFIIKSTESSVANLYLGSNLFFHIFIPLVSVANWICLEHTNKIEFKKLFYVFIYVVVYGIFYISIAYTHIKSNGTIPEIYDWYKFCSFNPVVTLFIYKLILGITFGLTLLFWQTNKKINLYK